MARKKDEYKKAKTCIHGDKLTPLGGLYVKKSCPNEAVIMAPGKDIRLNIIKCKHHYILAKKCNKCEFYKAKEKKSKGGKSKCK